MPVCRIKSSLAESFERTLARAVLTGRVSNLFTKRQVCLDGRRIFLEKQDIPSYWRGGSSGMLCAVMRNRLKR
jgi:hypothetical protein